MVSENTTFYFYIEQIFVNLFVSKAFVMARHLALIILFILYFRVGRCSLLAIVLD